MLRTSLIFLAAFAMLPAVVSAAEVKVSSDIQSVTVFPSGAEVTRQGKVKLEQGEHTVIFEDLPAQAIASSIRVEGSATAGLEIGSVDTRRIFLSRADAEAAAAERKRIEDEIETLKDQRTILEGTVKATETQRTLVSNLANLPNRPQPVLGSVSGQAGEDWSALVGLIGSSLADIEQRLLDAKVKIRETNRSITDLQKKLSELAPRREEVTQVKVFATAAEALEADLTVRYQVSSASWTALYTARLSTGTKTQKPLLQLTRQASITQSTGEAWNDIDILLSTTRPKAGTDAPKLRTTTVDYKPKPQPRPARPVAMSAPAPAMEAMAEADDGRMKNRAQYGGRARAVKSKVAAKPRAAKVVNAPFQAIFEVPGKVTVDPTGTAKRVQISQETLEPAIGVRTVPKINPTAYLFAELKIPKGAPVLPGQVSLFRDGTYVGTGRMPLLAGAEDHKLGFGIDDLVRVKYNVAQEKQGESGLISSSKNDNRAYRISVKNLHARAMNIRVLDQIPVSKNEDIKVELTGKTAPTKRDVDNNRGVLAWDLNVEPEQESTIEFGYKVSWPADKEIRYRR